MFKKKKDPLAPAREKTSIGKKAERGFFHIFNNKSKARRVAFVGVLAWLPAYGMATTWEEDASKQRGPNGAESVQQYQNQISQIARDSYVTVSTTDDLSQNHDLNRRAIELAQRLALDTGISEQDARDLANSFLRDVNDDVIGPAIWNMISRVSADANHLEEARESVGRNGTSDMMDAMETLRKADGLDTTDSWYRFFLAYVFIWPALQTGANALLRKGARRDDELKEEERRDNYQDKVRDLRDMMRPKDAPADPAKPKRK